MFIGCQPAHKRLSSTRPSASLGKVRSWIHSELGVGWEEAGKEEETRDFGMLVRVNLSV